MKTAKVIGFLVGLFAAWSLASAATVDVGAGFTEGDPGPFGIPLYVRGSMNDWGNPIENADLMTWDGDSYVVDIFLDPCSSGTTGACGDSGLYYHFKIADESWATVNAGTSTGSQEMIVLGTPIATGGPAFDPPHFLLDVTVSGPYRFDWTPEGTSGGDGGMLTVTLVPIPAAFLLLGSALMGLGIIRRRKF